MASPTTHTPTAGQYVDARTERRLLVISVGLISLIAFEALAVATAMPTVVDRLHGHHFYALAMGVVLATQIMTTALAGPWSDSRSPQSCLYTGVALLGAGLTICTFAPNMLVFVAGRAIQGLGGGLCIVPLYTLIGNNIAPSHRPKFFAAFAAAWVVPGLVGPAVAGIVVEHTSWRWIFGVVPALLALSSPVFVGTTRKLPHHVKRQKAEHVKRTVTFSLLTGISVALLQVTSGTNPERFTPTVYITIVLAAFITFVCLKPLLPRGTYISRRGLASTVLLRGLLNGSFIGVEAFLPLMLQEIHGWSPAMAGLVLTASSVTWAIGSALQARVKDPLKRPRLAVSGTAAMLGGLVIASAASFHVVPGALVILGWVIGGFGIGVAFTAMSVHSLAMTPLERQGKASSALQLADTVGAAVAIAVAGIVYAIMMPAQEWAFFGATGVLCVTGVLAVIVSRRVAPHPGSKEELCLLASAKDDASVA